MKKKIGIILSSVLVLVIIFTSIYNSKAAKAEVTDGVIGTHNLNNTELNSAKVGDTLSEPEKGWKRYDDSNSKILYKGTWLKDLSAGYYGGSQTYSNTKDDSITFKMYGSKFRLIMAQYNNRINENNIEVFVDGASVQKINTYSSMKGQVLTCEYNIGTTLGVHSVKLNDIASDGKYILLDAIDIDEAGSLIDPSLVLATGITLDKTSIDLNINDSANIAATVAPTDTSNKAIKWTSSDNTIVTVDANGKVTAIKEGSVKITATTQDGTNLSAYCTINVKNPNSGNGLLTVIMTNGQQRTYDLTKSQINDFITWYNNKSNGQGASTYQFSKNPSSAAYSKRTEYVIFEKISNFDVDEYKVQN